MREVVLNVKNLVKWFPVKQNGLFSASRNLKAVDGVSFKLYKGETLGLVGESGCGKSTLARTILRLLEPTAGSIEFKGRDFLKVDRRTLSSMRKQMQIIFQDPYGSLHPKMRVGKILEEPLIIAGYGNSAKRRERVKEMIGFVGLSPEHLRRFPHEFSGGQRQRIAIARSLATNPELIICDEPVSSLDVSVRSQILNLLEDLQEKLALTYLFISHDLTVVEHICDRIAVMYLGKIVEITSKKELFSNPLHPYTWALLSAAPIIGVGQKRERIVLEGDIPSPVDPPGGCRFYTRCSHAMDICRTMPDFRNLGKGHFVACHLYR
ncbi:MAG: dipeptide ABC transporter ATP-binding protein [Synergistaceae bacterium]|nr:dipeptide ABC transporter ATP-binding protein [Synergistaceae bacterium]